jgi:hypothetical protein
MLTVPVVVVEAEPVGITSRPARTEPWAIAIGGAGAIVVVAGVLLVAVLRSGDPNSNELRIKRPAAAPIVKARNTAIALAPVSPLEASGESVVGRTPASPRKAAGNPHIDRAPRPPPEAPRRAPATLAAGSARPPAQEVDDALKKLEEDDYALWKAANCYKYYFNYESVAPDRPTDHSELVTRLAASPHAGRSSTAKLVMLQDDALYQHMALQARGKDIQRDFPTHLTAGEINAIMRGLFDANCPTLKDVPVVFPELFGDVDDMRKNEIDKLWAQIRLNLSSVGISGVVEARYREVLGNRKFAEVAGIAVDVTFDEVGITLPGDGRKYRISAGFARVSHNGDQPLTNVVIVTKTLPKPRLARVIQGNALVNFVNRTFGYSAESTEDAAIFMKFHNVSQETPTAHTIYFPMIKRGDIAYVPVYDFSHSRHIREAMVTIYSDQGVIFDSTMMKAEPENGERGGLIMPVPEVASRVIGPKFERVKVNTRVLVLLRPQKEASGTYTFEGCVPIGETFRGTGQKYEVEYDKQRPLEAIALGRESHVALGPPRSRGRALILVPCSIVAGTKLIDERRNARVPFR